VTGREFKWEWCKIRRWVDGDTLEVTIDLGFALWKGITGRLAMVDAKERYQPGGADATAAVNEAMPPGADVHIWTVRRPWRDDKTGKYGRYLCRVSTLDGLTAAVILLEGDHIK